MRAETKNEAKKEKEKEEEEERKGKKEWNEFAIEDILKRCPSKRGRKEKRRKKNW
ncbi:hypothetical protein TRV_02014 [Trichophyton verrucosum HKI 0517]|uniref:Uncharacterized protein n=1 Tax=Trichophyton verrucosum (strain HKI 0517) TaxID=663202 RepID=D4D4J7_TRIVH|nr:uncharacterized protein TRV_02014 [Trichophyton verrucosum HKI 0517]EFE43199.1 hypothetical protein TRV_02014 [Trichophyton verrucosum HKI 0517]